MRPHRAELRARGLATVRGDLVLDRSYFASARYDPAAFDAEPLKPYNVGPDALLLNFKSIRFIFAPSGDNVQIRTEPALDSVVVHGTPHLFTGECGDCTCDTGRRRAHSAVG